jgi:hypothetical protein
MAAKALATRKVFPYLKGTVYSALGISVILLSSREILIESPDTLAWLCLLMLFEWETTRLGRPYRSVWEKWGLSGGRVFAYLLILHSIVGYGSPDYIAQYGALDLWNAQTWIAVVLLLEYDMHSSGEYTRRERYLRNSLKAGLYGALFLFALMAGPEGEWLGTYYATLWILSFAMIELNVSQLEEPSRYEGIDKNDPFRETSSDAVRSWKQLR